MTVDADFTRIYFQSVAAVTFLFLKVVLKSSTRSLAVGDGTAVIHDAFRTLGLDLAMIGLSILFGALFADYISISGKSNAVALVVFITFFVVTLFCYGASFKVTTKTKKWGVISLSWATGFIPYSGSIVLLLLRQPTQ